MVGRRETLEEPRKAATDQTTLEAGTDQTTVEAGTDQTTVEAATDQTTLEAGTDQTTLEAGTDQTTLEAATDQTTVEAGTDQTTVEAATDQTNLEAGTEGFMNLFKKRFEKIDRDNVESLMTLKGKFEAGEISEKEFREEVLDLCYYHEDLGESFDKDFHSFRSKREETKHIPKTQRSSLPPKTKMRSKREETKHIPKTQRSSLPPKTKMEKLVRAKQFVEKLQERFQDKKEIKEAMDNIVWKMRNKEITTSEAKQTMAELLSGEDDLLEEHTQIFFSEE